MLAERVKNWTEEWKAQGLQQGLEQGLEKGVALTRIQIAKNMLAQGVSDKIILEATELSDRELQALKT